MNKPKFRFSLFRSKKFESVEVEIKLKKRTNDEFRETATTVNDQRVLRQLAAESLHELLELRQGVLDEKPELTFRKLLVGLVSQKLESSADEAPGLKQGCSG